MTIQLGIYRHYKGNFYQVIGFARHTETLEKLVVYQVLTGDYALWMRPVNMFNENIIYNEQNVPRFKYIKESFSKIPSVK